MPPMNSAHLHFFFSKQTFFSRIYICKIVLSFRCPFLFFFIDLPLFFARQDLLNKCDHPPPPLLKNRCYVSVIQISWIFWMCKLLNLFSSLEKFWINKPFIKLTENIWVLFLIYPIEWTNVTKIIKWTKWLMSM